MPVVDAEEILRFQGSNHANECNLLLIWAVFFVAANVSNLLPASTLIRAFN
jgi:hypothetical protein